MMGQTEWEERLDAITAKYGPDARIEVAKFGDRLLEYLQGKTLFWGLDTEGIDEAETNIGDLRRILRHTAGVIDE